MSRWLSTKSKLLKLTSVVVLEEEGFESLSKNISRG